MLATNTGAGITRGHGERQQRELRDQEHADQQREEVMMTISTSTCVGRWRSSRPSRVAGRTRGCAGSRSATPHRSIRARPSSGEKPAMVPTPRAAGCTDAACPAHVIEWLHLERPVPRPAMARFTSVSSKAAGVPGARRTSRRSGNTRLRHRRRRVASAGTCSSRRWRAHRFVGIRRSPR